MLRYVSFGFAAALAFSFAKVSPLAAAEADLGLALVRQVPAINGGATVEGSIHMMSGGAVTLNGGATLTGDLLVPGTPVVRLNGKPNYGGTLDGTGPTTPSNYTLTLNGQATLRNVVRRTAPINLTVVPPPPAPAGTRSVTLGSASQPVGDWSTLRNLTLNGGAGQIAVPPGTYGDFIANGGTGFTLGSADSTTPAVYNLQRLTLNGQARIEVVGPVVLNLAQGLAANGVLGSAARPDWLALNIASGGLTLNGGCTLHAFVSAPAVGTGTVLINGNSTLVGGLVADKLIVNGGGLLRLRKGGDPGSGNTAPVADSQSLSTPQDTSLPITLTATDAEGGPLAYVLHSLPGWGTLALVDGGPLPAADAASRITLPSSGPSLRYTPASDAIPAEPISFTFRVRDAAGLESNLATVTIAVTRVNAPPRAQAFALGTLEDTPVAATLLGTDPEGTALTFSVTRAPTKGSFTGVPPLLTYHPTANLFGSDSFAYSVTDAEGAVSEEAVVMIDIQPVNDAPVAHPQALDTPEDTPLPILLTATDVEKDALSFFVTVPPAHGTLKLADGSPLPPDGVALSGSPELVYMPAGDHVGEDFFSFVVKDSAGGTSEPASIRLRITPVNDAPMALPALFRIPEDTPIEFTLPATDSDDTALTFFLTALPTRGALSLADGSPLPPAGSPLPPSLTTTSLPLRYVPAADFHGAVFLAFRVRDAAGLESEIAVVDIVVTPVNDAPAAAPLALRTDEDTPLPITLAGFDRDGDALTFEILTNPTLGQLPPAPVPASPGAFLYNPGADLHGPDRFTYRVRDAAGLPSSPATVVIEIDPVNDAPVAHSQSLAVTEGDTLSILPSGSDVDGDPLSYAFVSLPAGGTLTLADRGPPPALGQPIPASGLPLLYTPPANTTATFAFQFVARDASLASAPATITLAVTNRNDAPTATPAAYALDEDTTITITLAGTDPEGEALTYALADLPAHGTATLSGNLVTYRPAPDYSGPDRFTFTATDNGSSALTSAPAAIALTVRPVDDAPVARPRDYLIPEDTGLPITLEGEDVDGDELTFVITSQPAHGALTVDHPSGSFLYTPASNFYGSDSFFFAAIDSAGASSAPALIRITVVPVNDAPVAYAAAYAVSEGQTLPIVLEGADLEGDQLTFTVTSAPALGTLSGTAPNLTYTPPANTDTTVEFTFTVTDDGDPRLTSAPATVQVVVRNVPEAPVAHPQTLTLPEDTSLALTLTATDPENEALDYEVLVPPAHGMLSGTAPTLTYTPDANFHGVDTFTFVARDAALESAPAVVTLTVTPVNDAPLATPQSLTTPQDTALPITLAGTDVDRDSLTFTITTPPAYGTLAPVPAAPGGFVYSPGPGFRGDDSFAFAVSDDGTPSLTSAPALVAITVTAVNEAPVATPQSLTTPEDTALAITLAGGDRDGDTLRFFLTTLPAQGTLTLADGSPLPSAGSPLPASGSSLLYTPAADFNGSDSIAFFVGDPSGARSAPAVVALTVTPVNDAPAFAATNPPPVTHSNGGLVEIAAWATWSAGPANESPQTVTFLVSDVSDPELFTAPPAVDSAGTLRFTVAPNIQGESRFIVVARDNGGTAQGGMDTSAPREFRLVVAPPARAKRWTTTDDFLSAYLLNVAAARDTAFLATDTRAFNFLWVPISSKGTIVRIDADTGAVLGEYATAPAGHGTNPSRTAVAHDGSVWVGNRSSNTVTRIRVATPSEAPLLTTSRGLGHVLPWTNAGGADQNGGVSTAEDDLITHYVRVRSSGVRHLSINRDGDLWVGGTGLQLWDLLDGDTGQIIRQEPSVGRGGYGGLIDLNDILWSTRPLMRWDTKRPITAPGAVTAYNLDSYGTALDPWGNVWVAQLFGGTVAKFDPEGQLLGLFRHGSNSAQGVVVDHRGDVWVAHSLLGSYTIGHLKNDGTYIGNVNVGANPTGVAVDAKGRVWAMLYGGVAKRIDPSAGPLGADGVTPVGAVDLQTDYLGGNIYAYADMSGTNIVADPGRGVWSAVYDSGLRRALWAPAAWSVQTCNGSALNVSVALSEDGVNFGPAQPLALEDSAITGQGRYLRVEAEFLRAPTGESPVLDYIEVGTLGHQTPAWEPDLHVSAGDDIIANWPDTYALRGGICSNGYPVSASATYRWEQIAGPGLLTIAEPTKLQTQATASIDGNYLVRLTVTLDGATYEDTLAIRLTPYNRAPWVDTGRSIYVADATGAARLEGNARDDGLPLGSAMTVSWRQVHGPGTLTFLAPASPVTDVVADQPGIYVVEITATDGELSRSERCELRYNLPCRVNLYGALSAWWPANGTGVDWVRGNIAEPRNGATYAAGAVSMGFQVGSGTSHVRVGPHQSIDVGAFAAGFSLELWINPTSTVGAERRLLVWMESNTPRLSLNHNGSNGVLTLAAAGQSFSVGGFPANQGWRHVVVAFDAAQRRLRFFNNGQQVLDQEVGEATRFVTTGELLIGGSPNEDATRRFVGGIDEVSLYLRPLTVREAFTLHGSGPAGKCPPDTNMPEVSAGPDRLLLAAPGSIQLLGQVSDDGEPWSLPTIRWSQLGGAFATIERPAEAQTKVWLEQEGIYTFKLSATDGVAISEDTVEVRVNTGTTYPAEIPSGLVAWWPGNHDNREVVRDRSETGVNVTYTSGKVGGAYSFDGSNRHVYVAEAPGQTDLSGFAEGFTIEMWVRNETSEGSHRRVIAWASGITERVRIFRNSGNVYLGLDDQNHWAVNGVAPGDGWVHAVWAYDRVARQLRTYRNGVLYQVHAISASFAARLASDLSGDLYFGGLPFQSSGSWGHSSLDELSFYNRPLNATEIVALYNAGSQGKQALINNRAPQLQFISPVSGATLFIGDPFALSALAVDQEGALASVAFYNGATLLGTATSPDPASSSRFSFTYSTGLPLGTHVLTAVATDTGGLSATSAPVTVTVTYGPPSVALLEPAPGAAVPALLPLTLRASASYAGGPLAKVEFFSGSTKLGESTTPEPETGDYRLSVPAGLAPGAHTLTAKATAVDGVTRVSAPLTINAALVSPMVALTAPSNGAQLISDRPLTLSATATIAAGSIERVEFYNGATLLGTVSTPAIDFGPSTFVLGLNSGLPAGNHVLSARAIALGSGATTTSPPVNATAAPYAGPEVVELSSPLDGARLTAPTALTGIVARAGLASWKIEYRLTPADPAAPDSAAPWITLATGTDYVGTPAVGSTSAVPGPLGTFDPTLLLNGLYQLRLSATSTNGTTLLDNPVSVLVEGNMKVGAFSVAFNDLVEQTPGLPITLTRTYDSRDRRAGDFGPGWHLSLGNIRVQKNRHLGTGWYQTEPSGELGFISYFVTPVNERLVSVVMPDGETHRFRAGVYVKLRSGDDDNESFPAPARQGSYRFYPVGDTTSTLEPITFGASGEPVLADRFWIEGTGDQDLYAGNYGDWDYIPYNPTQFRLTTADGTVMLLDQALGLLELRDRNGNRLVIHRHPASAGAALAGRIESIDSIHALASGPVTRSVSITRLADGRVDYVTDLAGRTIDYLYDPQKRLGSVTDREGHTTQFRYERSNDPAHPLFHYLTKILDARGLPALRCEYDDEGRLLKQTDAEGRETVFDRGIDPASGRYERITDRLGRETTYFYDERGNIRTKIDPLGAVTTYDYYPDSDRVKFEEDHYGNVKAFAYDARGNVTVEILGASRSEEPATATTGYITRTNYTGFSAPLSITDPDGRVQSFTYDPVTQQLLTHTVGQLAPGAHPEIEAATPATTTYTYHPDGSLWTVTDALGNVTTTTYAYGLVDPAYPGAVKRVTTTVVDPAGPAGSDPANATATTLRTSFAYHDAQENLLATVTPRTLADGTIESAPTRHVYDAENRLRFTLLPDGRISETRYTSFGQTDRTLEWPVGTSLAALVAAGPSGPTAGARVTSYSYDARGNLERTTLPDGTFTATGYDAENRPVWRQDARGYRTFTVYDEVGRPRFTIPPDADDGTFDAAPASATDSRLANNPRSETIYDLIGRVLFQIDERGATTEFTYEDNCGCAMRRKEMIQHHPDGHLVTRYDYYPSGQVRAVTDPRNHTTSTRYDSHGRPVRTLLPATDEHPATETRSTYNVLGQRVALADQEGKITRHRHDALGRLVEVRQYLSAAAAAADSTFELSTSDLGLVSTRYTYDEAGNQTAQIDARGSTTRYEHDALGRRLKRTLPATVGAAKFEALRYDAWGDLWQRDDFAGYTTTFGYDQLHRLTSKQADAAHPSFVHAPSLATARVEYDYDDNGARESARTYNAAGQLLYAEDTPRDERGRIDFKDTDEAVLDYDYHANALLKDIVSSRSGGVNLGYRYDELNRLAFVDDASRGLPVRTTSYAYNANGSLEAFTHANGLRHAYRYDSLNRLRHLDVGTGPAAGTTVTAVAQSYDYRLRASGHRREVLEGPAPSGLFRTVAYGYDELYRLTGETITGDPLRSGSVTYELDKVGNREARRSTLPSVSTVSGLSFNSRDQLSTDSYDANGNTLQGGTGFQPVGSGSGTGVPPVDPTPAVADVYDFEDRLLVRTRSDLSKVYLGYDADGLRIQKTILNASSQIVATTRYLVCTNNLTGYAQVMEERKTDASGTTLKTYAYGHDLLAVTTHSSLPATLYYLYDGGGSVRALADESGAITDRYTYDAFGLLLAHQGSSDNAYLYRGEQYDSDLGLQYLRARFYNPDTGRFWNQDTYEGRNTDPASLHKYLYAHGNPVSFSDPTGHMKLSHVMMGLSVASTLWSMVQVVRSPSLENFGWLALDIGGASAAKWLGKAAKAVVAARAARGTVTAFRGGVNALRALQMRLTGSVIGLYDELTEAIAKAGGKGIYQANHINQAAAFTKIPHSKGLAVALEGGAGVKGSQHWKFHCRMDNFWETFRGAAFAVVTEERYVEALFDALDAAGLPTQDARLLADAAVDQAKHHGYFTGSEAVNIPKARTTPRGCQ